MLRCAPTWQEMAPNPFAVFRRFVGTSGVGFESGQPRRERPLVRVDLEEPLVRRLPAR